MRHHELGTMIGGLFMVGLPFPFLDDSTLRLIGDLGIHHFILFKRNVETPSQLHDLCLSLRAACAARGLPRPLIAIDQEGGSVTRLGPPFTQFPDARLLAESTAPEEALARYARICAKELLEMGLNLNFAPVLDICPRGQGFFMERRALGEEPFRVAALGALVIATMQQHGLAACAKHFPGLGRAVLDPHHQLPVVEEAAADLRARDLVPFQRAVAANVAAVMTSHTIYTRLDPDHPATLSPTILTGLLRRELAYDGLIVTDDLEMGAIENRGAVETACPQALRAGADLLLICHDHDKVRRAVAGVTEALNRGEVEPENLRTSLARLSRAGAAYGVA